jgi:enterochelin esterase family protein
MQNFWRDGRKNKDDFAALNIIGMSACYSPNPKSEAGFDLPFDRKSGEIRAEVWARWLAHDPARMAADHADALKGLGLLFLDAGARDEFALDVGARVLSAKFNELGIRHVHEEFDDGHFNIGYRYDRSLELISEAVRG